MFKSKKKKRGEPERREVSYRENNNNNGKKNVKGKIGAALGECGNGNRTEKNDGKVVDNEKLRFGKRQDPR